MAVRFAVPRIQISLPDSGSRRRQGGEARGASRPGGQQQARGEASTFGVFDSVAPNL